MKLNDMSSVLNEASEYLESRRSSLIVEAEEIQDKITEVEDAMCLINTLEGTYQELLEMLDVMKGD